jgi:hypothetical protein
MRLSETGPSVGPPDLQEGSANVRRIIIASTTAAMGLKCFLLIRSSPVYSQLAFESEPLLEPEKFNQASIYKARGRPRT